MGLSRGRYTKIGGWLSGAFVIALWATAMVGHYKPAWLAAVNPPFGGVVVRFNADMFRACAAILFIMVLRSWAVECRAKLRGAAPEARRRTASTAPSSQGRT